MGNPNNGHLVESIGELITASWRSSQPDIIERCLDQSADYGALPDDDRREILLALVHLEIELRRKLGQSPTSFEYARRFPSIGRESIEDLISLPAPPPVRMEAATGIEHLGDG